MRSRCTRGQGHVLGARVGGLGSWPVAEVHAGDDGGHLVGVDGLHAEVETGERHRVGADAAAEVVDEAHLRAQVPRRVPGGHLEPSRLLEAVGSEEHALGEPPELVPRPCPKPGLKEGGGDQLRRIAGLAQSGLQRQLGVRVVGRKCREQLPAVPVDELCQRGQIHTSSWPSRTSLIATPMVRLRPEADDNGPDAPAIPSVAGPLCETPCASGPMVRSRADQW